MLRHVVLALLLGLGGAAVSLSAAGRASATPAAGVVGTGSSASCDEAALDSALAGGGLITFNCGGSHLNILLTSFKTIAQPTTLDGGGLITLDGGDSTRLFVVNSGTSLTLQNIQLSNGYSGNSDGGAIVNHGTLALYHSAIFDSATAASFSGGAIFSDGPLTIVDSDFSYNQAGSAGAIFVNFSQAQVSITEGRFQYNQTTHPTLGYGGAIWVGSQAHLSFTGGRLAHNTGHYGGGLYLSPGAVVTMTGGPGALPVDANAATHSGGAIYNDGGQLALSQVGFQHNRAYTGSVSTGYGGAVASYGPLTVAQTTFFENNGRMGGGLYIGSSASALHALIDQASFQRNIATAYGGGLFVDGLTTLITVTDSSFDFNYGALLGGGLALQDAVGLVERSSFQHNQANVGGGLAYIAPFSSFGAGLLVRNSTFSANMADSGQGGGLSSYGYLGLVNATVINNATGLYVSPGSPKPMVGNTVMYNPGYANCTGGGGPPITDGGNYANDTTCAFTLLSDQQALGLDPLLGSLTFAALTNHTYFHPVLAGSPLINAGVSAAGCSPIDQIAGQRHNTCDIGAVEFDGLLPRLFLPFVRR